MENNHPKHIIAVSAYVTNDKGEALLVKTHWRSDTWEAPGGQVEEGEPLDKAVSREILEDGYCCTSYWDNGCLLQCDKTPSICSV